MNLLTLVSSLVLAASTATAGLLVAPPLALGHTAADDPAGPGVSGDGWCIGFCGNDTAPQDNSTQGNQTFPLPPPFGGNHSHSGNETRNETSPPASDPAASPPATCGVEIHDSRDIEGATHISWKWAVGTATTNLTVDLEVDGTWVPLGGGARVSLVDGNGDIVASGSNSGYGLPFDYTYIHYTATAEDGLAYGEWHVDIDANGLLGSAYLDVHGEC